MKKAYFLLAILVCFSSCTDNDLQIPKPPTYLRLDLPQHNYQKYTSECGYSFDLANAYSIKNVYDSSIQTCHKDIDLGPLNGVVHFSFIEMTESLATYVNFANDKVDEHKIKATAIEDQHIIFPSKKVYGTFFELQGNVATPFQFYLTDSLTKFVNGVVYFNTPPNYDSLKPSLQYLKTDLLKMVNSFEW